MILLNHRMISPEGIRNGFITDEDPLGEKQSFAEAYHAIHRQSRALEGYASLFNEVPTFPTPERGREILKREGFTFHHIEAGQEIWTDSSGIVATFTSAHAQAVIHFHFQTIFGAGAMSFRGSFTPTTLANGDIVRHSCIHAEPGVLQMLRTARPHVLRPWKVLPPGIWAKVGNIPAITPQTSPKQYKPLIAEEETFSFEQLMDLSHEKPAYNDHYATTTSGNQHRFWYKPFQGTICFVTEHAAVARAWLQFYLLLGAHAHANGCRLNERSALELQSTGKISCRRQKESLKVLLLKQQPTIMAYEQEAEPELPEN